MVKAEEIVIDSQSLPDNGPSAAPPGAQNIRVSSLITQLKTSPDLGEAFIQDLNREDVQLSIVENNPILFSKFPANAKLQFNAMEKLAKKVYRFDFFIPRNLRNQDSVKKAFKLYAREYNANFEKYLEAGRKHLHEGQGVAQIHPDFFYDSTFTFLFAVTCSTQSNYSPYPPGYPHNFPPPGFPHSQHQSNQPSPQAVAIENRKQTFYYFKDEGIFNKQQKDLFLKKHPNQPMPEHCYPSDYLSDEYFIQQMVAKFPHANFIEMAFNRKKSPKFKDMYTARLVVKISNDHDYPKSINKISAEDLETEYVQNWIFQNPEVIKYIDSTIKWNYQILENFAKNQYKPNRFFSESQKTDQKITEILEKYKNEGPEFLKLAREVALKSVDKVRCCGPSYDRGLKEFINDLPAEFKNEGKFHIEVLSKLRTADTYLKELGKIQAYPQELKDHIVKSCKDIWGIREFGTERAPSFIKDDVPFYEKLKENCK